MAVDHSKTYKRKSLRNTLHRGRLRKIIKILDSQNINETCSYLDLGCSNGYITNLIKERYCFSSTKGMDHQNENLDIARKQYPDIKFEYIDLNDPPIEAAEKYDVITCFETLEHVGNLKNATQGILSFARKDSSHILIGVPIEIGLIGVIKFILKMLYGYNLKELKNGTTFLSYFKSLISDGNISKYRDKREGWGTHFGFDYREVDEILNKNKCVFEAKNLLSTRFYSITNCN